MEDLSEGSYQSHQNCSQGDTVIATTESGQEYTGTVVRSVGATVYVQSDTGGMLEFRRANDSDTGRKVIFLGIDGKDVEGHGTERGVNPKGKPIEKESSTLSFDKRVIDFESETQQVVIGEESSERE